MPATGNFVVADRLNHRIRHITFPGAVVTTLAGSGVAQFADGVGAAASFNAPYGIVVFPNSASLVTSDAANGRVRFVTIPDGIVTSVGGGSGTATDGVGAAATFADLRGVAITAQGIVIVGDSGNNKLRAM